ncbi:MAG: tRNA pseudouridine(55) synthase TruB [Thermodesulfobacteriota bacterium]
MNRDKQQKNTSFAQQHGVLNLNKPGGITSTKCLEKIKKVLGQKKIGHAGTLDPLAEGVLVVLLGEGTKLEPYLGTKDKVYRGCLKLGQETDTYDTEGEIIQERSLENIDTASVQAEIEAWTKMREQEIPEYSAAKHKGKPLYELKRKGCSVPKKTKSVQIKQAETLDIDLPFVEFWVKCSQGTFIRSLAHSLGMRLGCGAVLTRLVREESAPFRLDQAYDLDTVLSEPDEFPGRICSIPESLPDWPKGHLTKAQVQRVRNGKWLPSEEVPELETDSEGQCGLLLSPQGNPVALVQTQLTGKSLDWAILRGFSSFRQQ